MRSNSASFLSESTLSLWLSSLHPFDDGARPYLSSSFHTFEPPLKFHDSNLEPLARVIYSLSRVYPFTILSHEVPALSYGVGRMYKNSFALSRLEPKHPHPVYTFALQGSKGYGAERALTTVSHVLYWLGTSAITNLRPSALRVRPRSFRNASQSLEFCP